MLTALVGGVFGIALLTETTMPATTSQRTRPIKVAVCQILCIDSDRSGNFARIERALEQAKMLGAQIACFPESVILGWENPEAHKLAEPIPGKDSGRICDLARRFDVMICIGLDEKDGDKLYDSAIIVSAEGRILLKHRKINVLAELMDPPYSEGKPGDIAAVDTPHGRIGLMICADTFTKKHIEHMKKLRPRLVLVPYGWAAPNHKWPRHAKELEKLVCRIADQWDCPVVGTDLVGVISQGPWKGQTYGGASVVADAEGQAAHVLADRDVEVRVVTIIPGPGPDSKK